MLTQLGYAFRCLSTDIDESVHADEAPTDYVERLAIAKAQAALATLKVTDSTADFICLGSDTTVVIDHKILGKPVNKEDGIAMLTLLSNRKHQVLTAIAVVSNREIFSDVVKTEVFFKALTPAEIAAYWQSGEPQDKAGSYGIQGLGGQFVTHIHGSYSAVVGLPLYETATMLQRVNCPKQAAIPAMPATMRQKRDQQDLT